MKTIGTAITGHKVVPREEWIAARKELFANEKGFTQLRDQLTAQIRDLPSKKIDKNLQELLF